MATFLDTRYKLWHCLRMRLVEGVVWMGWDRDSVWITSNKWFVTTKEGLTFCAHARNFLPPSTDSNATSFTHGDWWWQRADRSSATSLHSLPLMVLGSYKRKKWLKSTAGLKSFILSHRPRERREAYWWPTSIWDQLYLFSISKSVEPNEEQKEMTSGFQQGNVCNCWNCK